MNEPILLSFDDLSIIDDLSSIPVRTAYIDESGGFGFDFSKAGTPKFYVLTAVVVENEHIPQLRAGVQEIKQSFGLINGEIKSSSLNEKRRQDVLKQLLSLPFHLVILVVDKKAFKENSPLTNYKKTFIKYLNNHLYQLLYKAYPKLSIVMDQTGWPEFITSFKKYVANNRPEYNLFNQYDFDFIDSKEENLVQIADVISGSICKYLNNPNGFNYLELLKGKIVTIQRFPNPAGPYFKHQERADTQFDREVYILAVKLAKDYISKNDNKRDEDIIAQVATLKHLLFYVNEVDAKQFVYSDEILAILHEVLGKKITKDYLFRRVIAPLRDEGIILASCVHGYKIPISVKDINTYLNQTSSTVWPMLRRLDTCRRLIKQGTSNSLDIFDNESFISLKRLFD